MYLKVFKGNEDRDSIVHHQLNAPIKARYVKLRPTVWYGHISLRMELYGCSAGMIVVLHAQVFSLTIVRVKHIFYHQHNAEIWIWEKKLICKF